MTFRVGQKVVCVGLAAEDKSAQERCPPGAIIPELGPVYTIRKINHWPQYTLILLEEINNEHLIPIMRCSIEPGFDIRGFRPVVERKTDISIFTAMLAPTPKQKVTVGREE